MPLVVKPTIYSMLFFLLKFFLSSWSPALPIAEEIHAAFKIPRFSLLRTLFKYLTPEQ